MTVFVAFLRAVNVGGTGLLPMKELAAMCGELGLKQPRTYIQSGNVVFESNLSESRIKTRLEAALGERMGKTIDVMVRTAAELRSILAANPFPHGKPSQVVVLFLGTALPKGALDGIAAGPEELKDAGREIYIHYPNSIGRSKLKLPAAVAGTARNINTLTKLVEMTKAEQPRAPRKR